MGVRLEPVLKTQESTLLRVVAQQPKKVANGVKNRAKVAQKSRSAAKKKARIAASL